MDAPEFPMRINKYLAHKGYATRRGADELIKAGKVRINGVTAVLGSKVTSTDVVEVGKIIRGIPFIYRAYHKPAGEAEPPERTFSKGVFPVGELDRDAHGLVIFSNDGRLTERLLSPQYNFEREYVVQTKNPLRSNFKQKMEAGVKIENGVTKKCRVKKTDERAFRVILTEEQKHQVRRMCVALFQDVHDVARVRIVNIELGSLKTGSHRAIEGEELRTLLATLKLDTR